jgi:hypothetical protein
MEREKREMRSLGFFPMMLHGGGDGHTMALDRGGLWCSDEQVGSGVMMRDWSWGGCGG